MKPEYFEIGKTVSADGLPCNDHERTICEYFKNHHRLSYRRLRELSKKYRDSDAKNIDLLKTYAEQLNLSVAAMKKMDWMILRCYRPKKEKTRTKNHKRKPKNKSTPKQAVINH